METVPRYCCSPPGSPLSSRDAQEFTDALEVFANPVRVQLLAMLVKARGEVCVCDLEAAVAVKQPTVSHHLRILRESGVIDCVKKGLWVHYFVRPEALASHIGALKLGFDELTPG